jgi:hypothetical protein
MRRDRRHYSGMNIGRFPVSCPCHICALFKSTEHESRILHPFIREGYERGERIVLLMDLAERSARQERMSGEGIDAEAAQRSGGLEIMTWGEAYLRDDKFDAESMLELVKEILSTSKLRGFRRTRLWANMEWALTEAPGVEQLARYESRLNHFLPLTDDAVVCVYNLNKFSGKTIQDILRAHPQVFEDGELGPNNFYEHPNNFNSH